MNDDELESCIDILRESTTRAFNHFDRREAIRLGSVFHALLRERERRQINEGTWPCKPVLPTQGSPSPLTLSEE